MERIHAGLVDAAVIFIAVHVGGVMVMSKATKGKLDPRHDDRTQTPARRRRRHLGLPYSQIATAPPFFAGLVLTANYSGCWNSSARCR